MSKADDWMPFRALLWRIVEQELHPLTQDWSTAISTGWHMMFTALENEAWVARTAKPTSYKFRKGRTNIPLGESGTIHQHFWECLREAEDRESPLATLSRESGSWAERNHGDEGFMFYIRDRASGATAGAVERVEIRIDAGRLAKIPTRRRGRPPGSSRLKDLDRIIVDRARAYMATTGATPYNAAMKFGAEMPGGATEVVKIDRLRETLLGRRSLD